MIPSSITRAHILEAIRRIIREGVPSRRNSRGYCLVEDGRHFPPKYTITLAHEIAKGQPLRSDKFSGGHESNSFLKSHGFDVIECGRSSSHLADSRAKTTPTNQPTRHSERCPDCKTRVRELLERIYGTCLPNHKFSWSARLSSYEGTSIFSTLQNVVTALEKYRGFGFKDFVKTKTIAPCDFWVPNPGFIVEFDESQHFTNPRKLALSMYPDDQPLGFSRERWIMLCEQHDAKDNDPPYRDEQRAWYDTLRDLIPSLEGFQPTVRLYARDFAWCSLNPDSSHDLKHFSAIALQGDTSPTSRTMTETDVQGASAPSTLRVALVFPETNRGTSNGVPPCGAGAQRPRVPALDSFADEDIEFVLFPEGYICSSDSTRIAALSKLASDLGAPLLVGAVDKHADSTGRVAAWQILLRFDPDGSWSHVYTKHSTAEAVAFEKPDWKPSDMLPTFELGSVRAGATICHDHYLGLLPRFLAKCGARVWVNPSFDNVKDVKWSSILRLRAVENRTFALCTLHDNKEKRSRTHPFAFSPDGNELLGRQAGSAIVMPLSQCKEPGNVYVIDLDMGTVGKPLDWSRLPPAEKEKRERKRQRKPVHVKLIDGQPAILGRSGWQILKEPGRHVETDHGPVYVGSVPKERILDAAECFRVLERAKQMGCVPVIWNVWDKLPTDSARLATLMMGRAIECCSPILVSDRSGIHELVELSNRNKIPARRTTKTSGKAIVDIENAWGLGNAFKIVSDKLPKEREIGRSKAREYKRRALDRYRSLD